MPLKLQNGSIPGEFIGVRVQRSRSFAPRRICAAEGCATILSIYNPNRQCGLHLL
jgi:hypothetical protein